MSDQPLVKASVLMATIVVMVFLGAEIIVRAHGVTPCYDEGPPLWSNSRAQVYGDPERTVVFIGSSRIKFDLNIALWEQLTGTKAVQLAIEGGNPRPALYDLADDPDFKGRLVVDVTEGIFFDNGHSMGGFKRSVRYYHDQTPAQKVSFWLNRPLESALVILDEENFSLNACLNALEIPSRPGVFMMPVFPLDFSRASFNRETRMTDRFVSDTSLQQRQKDIWAFFDKEPPKPMPSTELDSIFSSVKEAVDNIQSRGGTVVFVRTPSTDPMYSDEMKLYPREKYWDRLLKETNCKGIHFKDFPEISSFVCPELSHLSPKDAQTFTRYFAGLLVTEAYWSFPNMKN